MALWLCVFALDALYGRNASLLVELVVFGCAITAMLVLSFYLTRSCAPQDRLRAGAVFPWIGWSLVSILPVLPWFVVSIVMFPDYTILAESPYWWLDALAFSAFGACGLAFLTFGSGHALDGSQPKFSDFWRAMKPLLVPGGIAYFLISLPSFALSNYADWFLTDETVSSGTRLLSHAAASFIDTISMVMGVVLSVIVFLKVDTARAD